MTGPKKIAFALVMALLATAGLGGENQPSEKPDLIVSDLRLDENHLVLEIQNQGPGRGPQGATVQADIKVLWRRYDGKRHTNPVSLSQRIPVPVEEFALQQVRIPLARLASRNTRDFETLISVVLDPDDEIDEEREQNNDYYKLLRARFPLPARPDYSAPKGLPDLVITDITSSETGIIVHYVNRGTGATGADFLVRLRAGNQAFNGDYYYRFIVPSSGQETKTGSLSFPLLGLRPGMEVIIETTIDPEGRVRESDTSNNMFSKKLRIGR